MEGQDRSAQTFPQPPPFEDLVEDFDLRDLARVVRDIALAALAIVRLVRDLTKKKPTRRRK